jgi:hypothetical protein
MVKEVHKSLAKVIIHFLAFKFIVKGLVFGIFFLFIPWVLVITNKDYHTYTAKLDGFVTNDFYIILFGVLVVIAMLRRIVKKKAPELLKGAGMFFITAVVFSIVKKFIILKFTFPPLLNDYIIYLIMIIPTFIYYYYDEKAYEGIRNLFVPQREGNDGSTDNKQK